MPLSDDIVLHWLNTTKAGLLHLTPLHGVGFLELMGTVLSQSIYNYPCCLYLDYLINSPSLRLWPGYTD